MQVHNKHNTELSLSLSLSHTRTRTHTHTHKAWVVKKNVHEHLLIQKYTFMHTTVLKNQDLWLQS